MPQYDEQPILALGTTPIPGSAPAGSDVADDEDYLLVQAEMAKLDRIDLGDPDWFQIESATLNLLQNKSKDVEMACALGYALFRKHRYAGLAATLGMFTDLVKTFWEDLFPTRPRRRKARIESLCEQLVEANWLRDAPPKPDEFDALDLTLERLTTLEEALKERMPDEEPDFNKFRRKLKDMQKERPKPAAPAPAPAAAAPEGSAPQPAAVAGGGAGFATGEVQDASGAMHAVLAAATFLRKKDAGEPLAYTLPRAVKWARVGLPPSAEARRDIPAPDKNLVEGLEFQFANGVWEHLLTNAEGAFRVEDPLWLDLQRYVCAALLGLGPQFNDARLAVMAMTGALVQRLGSGVYDLTYKGGRALCSGETRMWLEAEVLPTKGGGGGGGGGAANGKLTEATDAARKLAAGGKLAEAVGKLQAGLAECAQRRDRFLWKLHIAELCYETQRLQLAAPLLEECADEIKRYRIDEWEPGLAAQVAHTLYRCRKALAAAEKEPHSEVLARVRESYAWLCQLDPVAALAAEPAGR